MDIQQFAKFSYYLDWGLVILLVGSAFYMIKTRWDPIFHNHKFHAATHIAIAIAILYVITSVNGIDW